MRHLKERLLAAAFSMGSLLGGVFALASNEIAAPAPAIISKKKSLTDMTDREKDFYSLRSILSQSRRDPNFLDSFQLPAEDTQLLKIEAANQVIFDEKIREIHSNELRHMCLGADNADVAVLATTIQDIDARFEEEQAVHYQEILSKLSAHGLEKFRPQLRETIVDASSSEVDLKRMALSDPGLVRRGIQRMCNELVSDSETSSAPEPERIQSR